MTNSSFSNRASSVNPQAGFSSQKNPKEADQKAFQPNPVVENFDNLYDHLSLARAMSSVIWKQDVIEEIDDDILAKYLFGLFEHLDSAFESLNRLCVRDFKPHDQGHQ